MNKSRNKLFSAERNDVSEEFRFLLNSKSQRVTGPRLEILRVLKESRDPMTISEIHGKVKNKNMDLATVYRTVNLFHENNIVCEIDFKDEFKRYELLYDRNHHHHIVCRKCRKIENVDTCILNELEKFLTEKGYSEITHSLEFFGICSECRKN